MKMLFFVLALSFTTLASCQNVQPDTVYVTDTGRKYHKETCHYLKYSKRPLTLLVAEKEGYTPCKICYHSKAVQSVQKEKPSSGNQHSANTRCQATTKKGSQCKRNAASGSQYCWQHQ